MAANEHTSIPFPDEMATAARRVAADEGKSLGQWVREVVSREIKIREGACPACGQQKPPRG